MCIQQNVSYSALFMPQSPYKNAINVWLAYLGYQFYKLKNLEKKHIHRENTIHREKSILQIIRDSVLYI